MITPKASTRSLAPLALWTCGQGILRALTKSTTAVLGLVEADADDLEARVVIGAIGRLEPGQLGDAGPAPGRPEVEQDVLAAVGVAADGPALDVLGRERRAPSCRPGPAASGRPGPSGAGSGCRRTDRAAPRTPGGRCRTRPRRSPRRRTSRRSSAANSSCSFWSSPLISSRNRASASSKRPAWARAIVRTICASALTGPSGSDLRYCRPRSSTSANQSCSIALLKRAAYAWSRSSALGCCRRYSASSRIKARSCLAWISATLAAGGSAPRAAGAATTANPASSGAMQADVGSHGIGPQRATGEGWSCDGDDPSSVPRLSGACEPRTSAGDRSGRGGRPGRPTAGPARRRAAARAGRTRVSSREQVAPLGAAELPLVAGEERRAAPLAHPPRQAGVGGQARQRRDQAVDVAAVDGDAAAGRADRVGRLAVLAGRRRRPAGPPPSRRRACPARRSPSSRAASRSGARRPSTARRAAAPAARSRGTGCSAGPRARCAALTSASRGPSPDEEEDDVAIGRGAAGPPRGTRRTSGPGRGCPSTSPRRHRPGPATCAAGSARAGSGRSRRDGSRPGSSRSDRRATPLSAIRSAMYGPSTTTRSAWR